MLKHKEDAKHKVEAWVSGRDVGVSELLAPGPGATSIGLSLQQIYGNPYEHRHLTPSLPYTVIFEGEKKALCE